MISKETNDEKSNNKNKFAACQVFDYIYLNTPNKSFHSFIMILGPVWYFFNIIFRLLEGEEPFQYQIDLWVPILLLYFYYMLITMYSLIRNYGFSFKNQHRDFKNKKFIWKNFLGSLTNVFTIITFITFLLYCLLVFGGLEIRLSFISSLVVLYCISIAIYLLILISEIVEIEAHDYLIYASWVLDNRKFSPIKKFWKKKVKVALFLAEKQYTKDFKIIQYNGFEEDMGFNSLDKVGKMILLIENEQAFDEISTALRSIGRIRNRDYTKLPGEFTQLSKLVERYPVQHGGD